MWPTRDSTYTEIYRKLSIFSDDIRNLPGVREHSARQALAMQIVSSLRRLDYTKIIRARDVSQLRTDPTSPTFDPERAAILHARTGNLDEAFWLAFLSVHFGKHLVHGWKRVQDVYSGLGAGVWTWERTSATPNSFRDWLREQEGKIGGAFGNHRKYESLKADSQNGTAAVVESYIAWVGPNHSHNELVSNLVGRAGNHPNLIFHEFYTSMNVARFGRLGKFDFLSLAGRLGLAPLEPGKAYLRGATGPLRGAKLLFGGEAGSSHSEEILEAWLCELDDTIGIGMQAMEDSLCNWQKSPSEFVYFRG